MTSSQRNPQFLYFQSIFQKLGHTLSRERWWEKTLCLDWRGKNRAINCVFISIGSMEGRTVIDFCVVLVFMSLLTPLGTILWWWKWLKYATMLRFILIIFVSFSDKDLTHWRKMTKRCVWTKKDIDCYYMGAKRNGFIVASTSHSFRNMRPPPFPPQM